MALIGEYDIFRYSSLKDEIVVASQVTITAVIVAVIPLRRRRRRCRRLGGSVPGKKPNREIGRDAAENRLEEDYYGRSFTSSAQTAAFSNEDFERRIRMPRCIYENIRAALFSVDPDFFEQRPDALGTMGATTDQKFTSALRQLCYGATANSLVERLRLSESLKALCLKHFCYAIILALKSEYLRLPNCDKLKAIEAQYSAMGFPGCIGCVDVASWYWNNCPVGWHGQYRGK
jgi:hypothetical protein